MLLQNIQEISPDTCTLISLNEVAKSFENFFQFLENFEDYLSLTFANYKKQGCALEQEEKFIYDENRIQQVKSIKDLQGFILDYQNINSLHHKIQENYCNLTRDLSVKADVNLQQVIRELNEQIQATEKIVQEKE